MLINAISVLLALGVNCRNGLQIKIFHGEKCDLEKNTV